jgi:hypothetical protein
MAKDKAQPDEHRKQLFCSNVMILLGITSVAIFAGIYWFLEAERGYMGQQGVIVDPAYPFILMPLGIVLIFIGYLVTRRHE